MIQEEKVRLVNLHSPFSFKTKSNASHVIISLMSWSSLKTKDEHNLSIYLSTFLSFFLFTHVCAYIYIHMCIVLCSSFIFKEDHDVREMITGLALDFVLSEGGLCKVTSLTLFS